LDPLPRPDAETYITQMIKDLTEAIPDLPEKTNGTADWGDSIEMLRAWYSCAFI